MGLNGSAVLVRRMLFRLTRPFEPIALCAQDRMAQINRLEPRLGGEGGGVLKLRNVRRPTARATFYCFVCFAALVGSFFSTLAILDSFGEPIARTIAAFGGTIRQIINPSPKIVRSLQLDLQRMVHETGSVATGVAIATEPKDAPGLLLVESNLRLAPGRYRADITFNCLGNQKSNRFEIAATYPSYTIARFEMPPHAPSCNGLTKDVALDFRTSRFQRKFEIRIIYGGSGSLQVSKIVLQTLAEAN